MYGNDSTINLLPIAKIMQQRRSATGVDKISVGHQFVGWKTFKVNELSIFQKNKFQHVKEFNIYINNTKLTKSERKLDLYV